MADISTITVGSTTYNIADATARSNITSLNSALNAATASQILYFTNVSCTSTTGNFASYSNSSITADHVLLECSFSNPTKITTDVTWTTANGSLTLNGTCTASITAKVVLGKKGN